MKSSDYYKQMRQKERETYWTLRKIKEQCITFKELNNPIGEQVLAMIKDLLKMYDL